jgi:hypothetical protein
MGLEGLLQTILIDHWFFGAEERGSMETSKGRSSGCVEEREWRFDGTEDHAHDGAFNRTWMALWMEGDNAGHTARGGTDVLRRREGLLMGRPNNLVTGFPSIPGHMT